MTPRLLLAAALVSGTALCGCAGASTGPATARSGCFEYSFSAAPSVVRAGEPVTLTVDARNVSTRSCYGHSCGGITGWFEIIGDDDRVVFRTNPVGITCRRDAPRAPLVPPGRSTRWDQYMWPDRDRGTPSPGRFTARWHWLGEVTVSSPAFVVTRA